MAFQKKGKHSLSSLGRRFICYGINIKFINGKFKETFHCSELLLKFKPIRILQTIPTSALAFCCHSVDYLPTEHAKFPQELENCTFQSASPIVVGQKHFPSPKVLKGYF